VVDVARPGRDRYKSSMNSGTLANPPRLPKADNTATGLKALLQANERYHVSPWPVPFCRTQH
jgi:hypothetical protein